MDNEVRELEETDLFLPDLHNDLYNCPAFMLGKILYRFLFAHKTLEKFSHKKLAEDEYVVSPIRTTEFGSEVYNNEVVWWLRKKETNIPELSKKTKNILDRMDDFKHAVDKIKQAKNEDYGQIIQEIKNITTLYGDTIQLLCDYVEWLSSKDRLAPCILFNYKAWGSSPMSNRTIEIDLSRQNPTNEELTKCTDIACGLRIGLGSNAINGIFIEKDNEQVPFTTEFLSRYRMRISHEIRNSFHQFVEKIRIALQHIVLEIEKNNRGFELLTSKNFWQKNISKIMALSLEDDYYDFKKSLSIWNKPDNPDKEKFELCEDIAALANSTGGVLIVGVSDKKPRKIYHIDNLENRSFETKKLVLDRIKYEKDPTHFIQFSVCDDGIQKDCLIIGVEQTREAVSVLTPEGNYSWPIRLKAGKTKSNQEDINKSKRQISSDNADFMIYLEGDISN